MCMVQIHLLPVVSPAASRFSLRWQQHQKPFLSTHNEERDLQKQHRTNLWEFLPRLEHLDLMLFCLLLEQLQQSKDKTFTKYIHLSRKKRGKCLHQNGIVSSSLLHCRSVKSHLSNSKPT